MPTHRSQTLDTLVFHECYVHVLLSGEFHMHIGPDNIEAWLLSGSLASFHLKCTAILPSVWAAVHQRKQSAKVILHLWDAFCFEMLDYWYSTHCNRMLSTLLLLVHCHRRLTNLKNTSHHLIHHLCIQVPDKYSSTLWFQSISRQLLCIW